jgi:hypothetical protein
LRLGLILFAKPIESLVRDDDSSFFRIDGRVWEVCRVAERAFCEGLEECGFAYVGKTDLAALLEFVATDAQYTHM